MCEYSIVNDQDFENMQHSYQNEEKTKYYGYIILEDWKKYRKNLYSDLKMKLLPEKQGNWEIQVLRYKI